MVNNIPVNGWPQLKDLEAVQPILNRLDKIESWKRTVKEETFTGDDITIENALALPARSLITEINAIQDLHGLPFPYVGGAYKNKLHLTVANVKAASTAGTWTGNKYTINGVVYELIANDDGAITDIKVTGTATGDAALVLIRNWTPSAGSYILNGCPSGGSGNSYMLFTSGVTANDTGSGANMTVVNESINVACLVSNGYAIPTGGLSFKPMVRLSTETDASFAPYSNICPISGRDSVVLTRSDGDEISEDFTIQLGTTVYGADINWDTGAMTVRTAVVDLGTLTYTQNGTAQSGKYRYSATITGIKPNAQAGVTPNIISSQYKAETPNDSYSAVDGITVVNSDIYIYDSTKNTMSVADFKTAMNGVTAEYELATPTTIQLTPAQLEMLKGYNHITLSDGYGTIELKALTGANWS